MNKGQLRVGIAEIDLEPELGLVTGDGAPVAQGQVTPLLARCLYLTNGSTEIALVTLDLLGIDRPDAIQAARLAEAQCGTPADAIMMVCSHTHVAPSMLPTLHTYRASFNPIWGEQSVNKERAWVDKVVKKIAQVVCDAKACQHEGSIGAINAELPWMIFNRRRITRNYGVWTHWMGIPSNQAYRQEGPIDPELGLIVVRDANDYPECLIWNFTGHNSFNFGDQYSADLSYTVQQTLDERLGKHILTMYTPGCSGNTNYHDFLQPIGLEKATEGIASAIMAIHNNACTLPAVPLGYRKSTLQFAQRDVSQNWWKADIAAKMPDWISYSDLEIQRFQQEIQQAETYPVDIQVFRIGEIGLVGLSAEAFVEFGLSIKAQSPFQHTYTATYANGYAGYVATREAFFGGSYEVWPALNARVGREGGYLMVDKAVEMLHQLDNENNVASGKEK